MYEEFLFLLRKNTNFLGDIETLESKRFVASTDNSIHQILPQAIIYPKNRSDIFLIVEIINKIEKKKGEFHLTARGGATATNGQSLNNGVIIDYSRYQNSILKLDLDKKTVKVEAGVVLSQLNEYLKPYGYFFAPNLSPSDRATIGGMIATDACGKGSIIYGKTSDHLKEVSTLLACGEEYVFKQKSITGLDKKEKRILEIVKDKKIREEFPDLKRFVSNYNLGKLYNEKEQSLDLQYLIAGSEGSLAMILEAELKITKIPYLREVFVAGYDDFYEALDDANNIVQYPISAIELMDNKILELSKGEALYDELKAYIGNSANINIIEFIADNKEELEQKIIDFKNSYKKNSKIKYLQLLPSDLQAKAFELRSLGVGIAGSMKGLRRPIAFIEDTVVPLVNIKKYAQELIGILEKYKLKFVIYGHLDVGCLHVRPALNLMEEEDKKILDELTIAAISLVKKYDGIVWGEHSIGSRVNYLGKVFSPRVLSYFKEIKELYDENYVFNLNKIVNFNDEFGLDKNLLADFNKEINIKYFEDFEAAIFCNGNTKCLSVNKNQVMCPSQKVTKEKIYSPKGRANLVRKWLADTSCNRVDDKFVEELKDSLDNCLGCKACSSTCPVSVDIPTYKSLFLHWYHSNIKSRKIREFLLCRGEESLRILHKFDRLRFLYKGCFKIINFCLGINYLPKISKVKIAKKYLYNDNCQYKEEVVFLLQDSFNSFLESENLLALISILEKLGKQPVILPFIPSGKAYFVEGDLDGFKKCAKKNIALLKNLEQPIICIEPAITLFFRQEYKKFFKEDLSVLLAEEYLVNNINIKQVKISEKISLLAHCTEKTALPQNYKNWQNIFQKCGVELEVLESGCCGMAGSYGYKKEFKKNSKNLFDLSWKEHFAKGKKIVATGSSCRNQVNVQLQKKIEHPLVMLDKFFSKFELNLLGKGNE